MTRASDTARLVSGGAVFNEASNDVDFRVESNGDANMLFVDAGNNKIGIGTNSPSADLSVDGRITLGDQAGSGTAGAGSMIVGANSFFIQASEHKDSSTRVPIVFSNIGGSVESMRIDASGQVGINTTSPETILHATATSAIVRLTSATNGTSGIDFGDSDDTNIGRLLYDNSNDTMGFTINTSERVQIAANAVTFKAPDGGSRFLFSGTSNSDNAELSLYNSSDAQKTRIGATVDSFFTDSNIFVGASSFTNGADVVSIHADQGSTGHNIKCSRDSTSTKNQIEFYNPNNKVGAIQTSGSNTSYGTSSDYRLKENIVTDWDATTRLKQLKPSRFNFIADADTTVDGFIAHEVSSIVPEAITGEKDAVDKDGNIEAQNIDQSKLVPLLTKALQEAVAKIETLEAKVATLESK